MRKSIFLILIIFFSLNSLAQNFDINLLNKINSPPASGDKTWEVFSNTASPVSFAVPITMFITGCTSHNQELKIKSYEAGASVLLSSGILELLKITIQRPRPFTTYPELIYKKTSGGGYSFPSGHTTAAFAAATSLSLTFPKWYVIVPSYLYASAIGYSRMYLGVHYPTDVLGGMIVGMGTSYLTVKAEKWLNKKKK